MATYKITYIEDASYSKKNFIQVHNVVDGNDAIDVATGKNLIPYNATITNVEFICE